MQARSSELYCGAVVSFQECGRTLSEIRVKLWRSPGAEVSELSTIGAILGSRQELASPFQDTPHLSRTIVPLSIGNEPTEVIKMTHNLEGDCDVIRSLQSFTPNCLPTNSFGASSRIFSTFIRSFVF